jgi:alanine racemase
VITTLKKTDFLIFKGLCTHYAGAESIANYYRVDKQIKNTTKSMTTFAKAVLSRRSNTLLAQLHQ